MTPPRKVLSLAVLAVASLALLAAVPALPVEGAAPDGSPTADIVYRSTTGSNGTSAPNYRAEASSWTAEVEQPDAGSPIRAVRIAQSPLAANARIFATQGDDGWLDAYVCTATCAVTNDIGEVWGSAPGTLQRRFDVAYEQRSGQALLVYGVLSMNGTEDLAYRTYSGGSWSAERFLDDADHASNVQYSLVMLASRLGGDQIGLLGGESTNSHVNAWIWDGDSFGSYTEVTANAQSPNRERAAIAWESASGHLLAMTVDANAPDEVVWKEFTTGWGAASNQPCGGSGNILRWLSLKPNPFPTANDMVLAAGDDGSDLGTCYWDGSGWGARVSQDTSLDGTSTRAFDFAWEASGNDGLLVYGTTAGEITYRTFSAPGTWGNATNVVMGNDPHAWVQLRTNPSPAAGAPEILGAVLEDATNALGIVTWDDAGLVVVGAEIVTSDAGTATYESFDLQYRVAGTSGTGPGGLGDPFTLPFGLQLDFKMLLILLAVAGAIIVAVAVRRRGRSATRGGAVQAPQALPSRQLTPPPPTAYADPAAPEEIELETQQWGR